MKTRVIIGLCLFIILAMGHGCKANKTVVPDAEKEIAQQKKLSGPQKTRGIESVTPLGSVSLAKDFAALKGRVLRARKLVIKPGGIVAVHQHNQRPGMAYILSGEIYEHRGGQPPVLKKAGAIAFEQTGVTHWWENKSNSMVEALVVDIVPEKQ